ncbi:MAG: aspartate/glutamate racemase family protein [Hoeflea sp.]|uniref:aspartate/glutamate racemase family protein n=1 Tax=Hoeflea sp. TaxID=1940281 RepID=UPI001DB88DD3|nr:aspartate/glutamate racemase family protein [Hoeflea sp.]MBU4529557.1 aspartate/glutamate racemase family protein [Alphaproteobacteria bacterium]MBU4546676.1 aspartate/glutamate racemase family protein [Alphaproteobacteria bacterium]MBU4550944.1 aspartate/glutamate racemase family protein [Alphaproteobacteria bacterium]MBV1723886.1 aspartate/glutamate racemase family protein [Hoeflea sp.]MBV1763163.1 aspartate/glutamate racemase family protein [Hoeflea sp.]
MRILFINPNTTASMTEAIEVAAARVASDGTSIVAVNPDTGPASIQGPEDGEAALPGLFAVFDRYMSGDEPYDAVVIACFDDTGLRELRARSDAPITGIGEAAYRLAARIAAPFSVVTTLAVSIPVLEDNIRAYGLAGYCAGVSASGIPVLDLELDPERVLTRIGSAIAEAMKLEHCGSIVLGCAGMADMAHILERRYSIPVIEGVSAAVAWCEGEVAARLAGRDTAGAS